MKFTVLNLVPPLLPPQNGKPAAYIDLLMLGRQGETGAVEACGEASERSRARVLLDLLSEARIDIQAGRRCSVSGTGTGARQQSEARRRRRLDQATKPELAVPRLKLELVSLKATLKELRPQLEGQSAIRGAHPATQLKLDEIQHQLDAGADAPGIRFSMRAQVPTIGQLPKTR